MTQIEKPAILNSAKYVTSYQGYELYMLGNLLIKYNCNTGEMKGAVLPAGEESKP